MKADFNDPISLKELTNGSNTIFLERGGYKNTVSEESQTKAFAFASVVATKNISKGEIFEYFNSLVS
jgi:N-acetylneuraminate synthase